MVRSGVIGDDIDPCLALSIVAPFPIVVRPPGLWTRYARRIRYGIASARRSNYGGSYGFVAVFPSRPDP